MFIARRRAKPILRIEQGTRSNSEERSNNQRRFYKHCVPTALFPVNSLLILSSCANTLSDEMLKTSEVEVAQILKPGISLLLREKEYFLSYENVPWFKNAPVAAIHNVHF